MSDNLVKLVEQMNKQIRQVEIEEANDDSSMIMKLLGPQFTDEIGGIVSKAIGDSYEYNGNVVAGDEGNSLTFTLEPSNQYPSAGNYETINIKVEYLPHQDFYGVKVNFNRFFYQFMLLWIKLKTSNNSIGSLTFF